MGNYTIFQMFENPRRGRQARNFTKNVPKIVDLSPRKPPNILDEWDGYSKIFKFPKLQKFLGNIFALSNSYFTEKSRWVPLTLQQALLILSAHGVIKNVIKNTKFQPSLVDKKVFKMWGLLGSSQPAKYSGLQVASVRSTFGRLQHIIQKIVNIHDLVVGH